MNTSNATANMNEQGTVVFLNNCKGIKHEALYGDGAFFDLNTNGRQGRRGKEMPFGQSCVVASMEASGLVKFDWFEMQDERLLPDDSGELVRVFFGVQFHSEQMEKPQAAKSEKYFHFFDVKGRFKQVSYLERDVEADHRFEIGGGNVSYLPEGVSEGRTSFLEGSLRTMQVNAYERSSKARAECIRVHGTACVICGFSFEKTYGEKAKGYIHVHHLVPLAEVGASYEVDPAKDLRPVCPNCHAVIHLNKVSRTIEEVAGMLQEVGNVER